MNSGETAWKRTACSLVIALVAVLLVPAAPAFAAVTSPNVVAFALAPPLINLNRTSSLTLEIGQSAGVGEDNYLVTVSDPDGAPVSTLWYNFSAVGSMSKVIGNASADFQLAVTRVGAYGLKAEWWNSTSAAFEPAATASLQVTDLLIVTTEFAAGSDDWLDVHNCQVAEEFQRGDGIIARGYVRYASTGEILNGTLVPTGAGNITGTLMGSTKTLNYNSKFFFWRAAWQLPWDTPVGVFQFAVTASDGRGNSGSAISPAAGYYGSLKVTPSVLSTAAWTQNATTGAPVSAFFPGETVQVVVRSLYDGHFNHNYAYTNTTAALKANAYPLGADRGGTVSAVLGVGPFNSTAQTFATPLASVPLTFDAASGNWIGNWVVPASGAFAGNVTVWAFATDGAPTPNAGKASATFTTMPRPEREVVTNTVYHNNTLYQNQTVEVPPAGSVQGAVAYGLAGIALAAGAGLGFVLAARRRKGEGGAEAPAPTAGKTPASKPAKEAPEAPETKEDEGWR
jgi:hypothetical protein